MASEKALKDRLYEGYVISGLDEKNKGRYKVYIPELMQKEQSSTGLLCRNNIQRYNLTTSEIGNFGSWLPLKPGTKVLVDFKEEDYSSGYIVSTVFEDQDDAMLKFAGTEKDERDEIYLMLKTAKNNCRIFFTEDLKNGIKNSFQLRHNKAPKRKYNIDEFLSKEDPLEQETTPYEKTQEEAAPDEIPGEAPVEEEVPEVEAEIIEDATEELDIPEYIIDEPTDPFLPEFEIPLDELELLPQDIIDDSISEFDLDIFEVYDESMFGSLTDDGLSILSDIDILGVISSDMKFGLLEDGSFIDIRRLSPEALIGIDIYAFDITNADEFDFDLINVENSLPIEGGYKDFFNHLKYYVPGDLLQDSPILLSEISVVILNTVENPPPGNNQPAPAGYVYVPKYGLYFKPDGTNFGDIAFKTKVRQFNGLAPFVQYDGGFISSFFRRDLPYLAIIPSINAAPVNDDIVDCDGRVISFYIYEVNGTVPCANFYNRLKYVTFTQDRLNIIQQEIAKAISKTQPQNNNQVEIPDSYVYVPKYDLYFKPDGTNFVDSSVKARIFSYIFNRDGFIEYEGGFIPVRLKNSIGHPGFPLIDQFPPDNNVTECKGLLFDHPSGRTNNIPCANFYNRLKYTTDTTDDINTVRQEIAKAIANR